jgi:hypothetical protein
MLLFKELMCANERIHKEKTGLGTSLSLLLNRIMQFSRFTLPLEEAALD